jgi:hypothetical protein
MSEPTKDASRAQRIADEFRESPVYEHLLKLRDTHDPLWSEVGNAMQIATAMYEQQRDVAHGHGRNG